MEFRSDRLYFSPISHDDIPQFVAYRRHAEVASFQSWNTEYSVADALALVAGQPKGGLPAAGDWIQLGLHDPLVRQERRLVGDVAIGVDAVQPSTFELGVTIAPEHQRRGFATEAVVTVIDWLMGEHNAHRVVMQCDASNAAIKGLLSKIGLRHEGAELEADWFKAEWVTLERFAMLKREWVARSS